MRRTVFSLIIMLCGVVAKAQYASSYLMAFDAKGQVKTIVLDNNGVKTSADFNSDGELTRYGDVYGEIPFTRSDRSFSITGRDPESITYYFDYNNNRISNTEGSTGMYGYKDKYQYSASGVLTSIQRTFYDGFDIADKKNLQVKILESDEAGNWTKRKVGDKIEKRTITYYESKKYKSTYDTLNKKFKVSGGVGIAQFVKATGIVDEPEAFECDKRNGYFGMYEEGSGHFICNAAYWNRKDGKKLFIVAYDTSDFLMPGDDTRIYGNSWSYSSVVSEPETKTKIRYEMGFKAYLYDPATKELVPMKQVPFNNWPQTPGYRYLNLPQVGKNINVAEGAPYTNSKKHTLTWNGMTFDYK